MSFESLDIQKKYEDEKQKKRELEASREFWDEKLLMQETSSLLQKLAEEISREFWIEISQAKGLIEWNTSQEIVFLRKSLENNSESLQNISFAKALENAQQSIESLSKSHREELRKRLWVREFTPETYRYRLETFFPTWLLERAKNPKNISDQMLGALIWFTCSTEAVILFTYSLAKGILLTPYHLYLLFTGKADFDDAKHL